MKHSHLGAKSIDLQASRSGLSTVNPSLKLLCSVLALVICVASKTVVAPIIILISMSAITLIIGKIKLHNYFSLMLAPTAFIAVGVAVILFDFSAKALGLVNLPIFGNYLVITAKNINEAVLVSAHAMGAISCLYALSLSTTSSEITGVLKKMHVPGVVIELMILIYRYIFVLLDLQNRLSIAANSRLGNCDFKTKIKTLGQTSSVLLTLSFKRSGECYDAMQSRLFEGEILFLEDEKRIKSSHLIFAMIYISLILACAIIFGGGKIG